MKKLLFITLVLAALLPVELWAQSTTGGDDGSDAVAAPTFRFDGDYLVIETATEDASIFYQMADLPDMSDETIEKVSSSITVTANIEQSNYYEQPIELKKSVVLKAIAAGATESEVSVLVYDYDSWHKLQEAIEYGEKIQSLAQDNANVDEDLKEQLKWILYESMHFYEERAMMPYQEAQHFTNHIFEICAQIEQQMGGQTIAEPYAVLSENNTVLTFYYDDQKAARNGMGVGPFSNSAYQSWYDQRESITSVVFDALFANCTTISSTAYWFFECKNLSTITDVKNLKTDNVTDMRWMFYGCSGLTSLDLSHFETSNVTDMGLMFYGCSGLTNLDLSHFNTSNVTDMSVMFSYCSSLTSLDVSHFETSNVTDIGMMFYGCSALVNIFGNNWDLSKLESGSMVFGNCTSLVGGAGTVYNANHTDYTYAHIDEGPSNPGYFTDKNAPVIVEAEPYAVLSDNNTVLTFYYDDQKATRNGMSVGPFTTEVGQNSVNTDSGWDEHRENIMSVVFDDSFANCTTLASTAFWFYECSALTSIIGMSNLKTDNVTDMEAMFYGCSNLTNLDLSTFKTDNVTNMSRLFYGCSGLTNLDLSVLKTDNVTDMVEMFSHCSSLTSLDLSMFKTDNVYNMGWMFSHCSSLTSLDLSVLKTDNVTVMNAMFYGCSSLTSLDLGTFKTDNVKYMSSMFYGCSGLTILDLSMFKTDNATDIDRMFSDCYGLKTIYASSDWSTASVTKGNDMFYGCTTLVGGSGTVYDANHTDYTYAHIDGGLSNPGYFTDKNAPIEPEAYAVLSDNGSTVTFYYDNQKIQRNGMEMGACDEQGVKLYASATKAVFDPSFANDTTLTTTAAWFYGCEQLKEISGLQYVNTSKVNNMASMFQRCKSLQAVDVSKFDTRNVENMDNLFDYCSSLTSLDLSNFNTAKVTTMGYMFVNCQNLTNLKLSSFDTRNVKSMRGMFSVCSSLTNLDLSNFNTESLETTNEMFYDCSSLGSLDLSSFNTKHVNDMFIMFFGCSSLKTIYVSDLWTTVSVTDGSKMFNYCSYLVGGAGTVYDANHTDYTYAHIDGGPSNPGYFTAKDAPVIDATFDSNGVLTIGSGTTMTDALESVGGRAEVAKTITAIVWNNETELTDADLQGLDNPNMLIYVNNESLAPQNRNNIITYDFAKNIVLTDVSEGNGNFYCPQEFKAETITYSREYNQTTEIGVARGWESIALPFAVQTITHETKGLIAPFGNDASNKHFWLRQLTENGLARATEIEPNTAYLISMPNNDAYYADFNLNGLVTFSSVDVWVPKTQIHAVDYHTEKGMVVLLPNFQRRASDYTTYALNVGEQRGDYPEGSVFEREYRDIRPFEAYTFHQGGSAPRFLPISDLNGDDATGIEEVRSLMAEGRGDVWYDMSGRRLQQKPAGKGVYILNGRKVVIK